IWTAGRTGQSLQRRANAHHRQRGIDPRAGKGGSLTATGSISGRATAALFRHRPRFRDNVLTMARRSLAHNFQAVWYRAAIMALCWPATPSEVKFAADSPLEGDGFELPVPVR